MPRPVGCRPQSSIRLFKLSLLNNRPRSTSLFHSHSLQIVSTIQFRRQSNPKPRLSTSIYTTLPANLPLPWQRPVARSTYSSLFFPMLTDTKFAFAVPVYTCHHVQFLSRGGWGAPARKGEFLTLYRTLRPIGVLVNVIDTCRVHRQWT
jgi:hypothetical protein